MRDLKASKGVVGVRGRRWVVLAVLVGLLASILGVLSPEPAWAGIDPANIASNPQVKANAVKMYTALKKRGYSDAAALVILAHADAESTFHPEVQNYLGCRGLLQWCFGRSEALNAAAPDWSTNIDAQVKYLDDTLNGSQLITANTFGSRNTSGWDPKTMNNYTSADAVKKEQDWNKLFVPWMTLYEVACVGKSRCDKFYNERHAYAEALQVHWKEIFGSDYGSNKVPAGGTDDGSKPAATACGAVSDKKNAGCTPDSDTMSEDKIPGMPNIVNLAGENISVSLIQKNDLSEHDMGIVGQLKDSRELDSKVHSHNIFAVALGVLGILIMVWSVVVVLAVMFDVSNPMVPLNLTRLVTFGRIDVEKLQEEDKNPLKSGLWFALVMFLLGVLVTAGGVFTALGWLNNLWQRFLDVLK